MEGSGDVKGGVAAKLVKGTADLREGVVHRSAKVNESVAGNVIMDKLWWDDD